MEPALLAVLRDAFAALTGAAALERVHGSYSNIGFFVLDGGAKKTHFVKLYPADQPGLRTLLTTIAEAIDCCGEFATPLLPTRGGPHFVDFVCDEGAFLATVAVFCRGTSLYSLTANKAEVDVAPIAAFARTLGNVTRLVQSLQPSCPHQIPPVYRPFFPSAAGVDAPAAPSNPWNYRDCVGELRPRVVHVTPMDGARELVEEALDDFEARVVPLYEAAEGAAAAAAAASAAASGTGKPSSLDRVFDGWAGIRPGWVHGDVNDINVIVEVAAPAGAAAPATAAGGGGVAAVAAPSSSPSAAASSANAPDVDGAHRTMPPASTAVASVGGVAYGPRMRVIDWDDMCLGYPIHDVAIALTYIVMGRSDIVGAAAAVLRWYAQVWPLNAAEVGALLPLLRARLATSLCMSATSAAAATSEEQRAYILVHAAPARKLLRQLCGIESTGNAAVDAAVAAAVAASGGDEDDMTLAAAARDRIPALDAAATAQLLHACGLGLAAVTDAGSVAGVTSGGPSYVARSSLPEEQAAASRAVIDALAWLGRTEATGVVGGAGGAPRLHPITTFDHITGTATAATGGAAGDAAVFAVASPSASSSVPLFPSRTWPESAPPVVYDFSGGKAAATGDASAAPAAAAAVASAAPAAVAAPAAPHHDEHHADAVLSAQRARYAGAPLYARMGWGRYNEDRNIYTSDHFNAPPPAAAAAADGGAAGGAAAPAVASAAVAPAPRTLHMGVDLELPPGTPIHAPIAGVVHSFARNLAELDYGPAIILQHRVVVTRASGAAVDVTFYTLYGHLSMSSILTASGGLRLAVGAAIPAGGVVGWVGDADVNGGWFPHLHFQINTEAGMGGWRGDYPGVCAVGDWPAYQLLCPDPNLLIRCPFVAPQGWDAAATGADVVAVEVV